MGLRTIWALCLLFGLAVAAYPVQLATGEVVRQTARGIPVAYEVDVAVVGGSTGAVAAAVAAAKAGARVFLAAPYPYLGDDIAGTLKLWLEEGEEPADPLAEAIYNDPQVRQLSGVPLQFTYRANQPSQNPHRDTEPPSRLTDGRWGHAPSESVQYNDSVTISLDLGQTKEIKAVRVVY